MWRRCCGGWGGSSPTASRLPLFDHGSMTGVFDHGSRTGVFDHGSKTGVFDHGSSAGPLTNSAKARARRQLSGRDGCPVSPTARAKKALEAPSQTEPRWAAACKRPPRIGPPARPCVPARACRRGREPRALGRAGEVRWGRASRTDAAARARSANHAARAHTHPCPRRSAGAHLCVRVRACVRAWYRQDHACNAARAGGGDPGDTTHTHACARTHTHDIN